MRPVLATAFEVAGLVAVSIGAFAVSTAAGLIVTGIIAVLVGYWLER